MKPLLPTFSKKTFRYFDGARRHARDRAWFEANREFYADAVAFPMTHLVEQLRERLGARLPGIIFSARKISKPLFRQSEELLGPLLRAQATAFFSAPATSRFEVNPGIYFSIGSKPDDNVCGCGLYMPSSRQMRELRPRLDSEAAALRTILRAKKLRARWQGLAGERYKRFPKGFDESSPGAEYLWHKQFLLRRQSSRVEVCNADFIPRVVEAFVAAIPFLAWVRNAVGVYRKPPSNVDWGDYRRSLSRIKRQPNDRRRTRVLPAARRLSLSRKSVDKLPSLLVGRLP